MDTQKLKENFILKAKKVHGNKYNYDNINYVNCKKEIELICPEHGAFKITPDYHVRGGGCPLCFKKGAKKITTDYWIEKAKEIHGNKYNYSKVKYKKASEPVIIICPKHGEFLQRPNDHLNHRGCPKCATEINRYKKRLTLNLFIEKAKKIHENDNYDYSLVNYVNNYTKITIVCPIHGKFELTPANHLKGENCPYCNKSKGELLVKNYLIKNNIEYIELYQISINNNVNKSGFAYLDFYIPEYNLVIEYNGEQHYRPFRFSGGILAFEHQLLRDKAVKEYCENNKMKLLEISYKYNKKEDIEGLLSDYFNRKNV